jgi:copper transport protein
MGRPGLRFVAALLVCSLPGLATAHAVLMDSAPKASQVLESSPAEVSVTFNESVGAIFFRVLDRAGKEVGKPGEIRLDGTRMIMPLGEPLANGTYLMTYRVISADTHPVGAAIVFAVGEPIAAMSAAGQADGGGTTRWTWAVAANRWLLYATMLLAAGSALFVLLLPAAAPVTAAALAQGRIAAILAALAYLLSIGFGGAEMVLGGAGALFSGATWARGLQSTLAPSAAIGVPAMLLLAWAFGRREGPPRPLPLAVGAAGAIASFLVTGHAATAPPVWMMATVVAVHLACTAFWLGSLVPLARSTSVLPVREAGGFMTAFSRVAVVAVVAVLLSGLLISWVQLGSVSNLLGNDYGRNLRLKLVLVLAVIGIALWNKFRLTPALERGEGPAGARIRRTISVEYALYLLILAAAVALTVTTPPRAIAAQGGVDPDRSAMGAGAGYSTTVQGDGYALQIEVTPARPGENMIMATVKDASGQPVTTLAGLEIVAALESAGISDLRVKGESVGNGMWHVTIKDMIIPGEWTLGVEAFVTDYDKVSFEAKVPIR